MINVIKFKLSLFNFVYFFETPGITTLYNVCAVPWGCSVPWGVQYRGGYHEYHGGYLEYRGVFSTVGDIMINVGDILSTVGMFSTMGDIMMHVGDIMSTVEGVQYRGGKVFCYLSIPRY